MTSDTVEPQELAPAKTLDNGWSRKRFLAAIAIIFALQLVMIFWLGERQIGKTAPAVAATPAIRMRGNAPDELLALNNPALFVLPNHDSFSGEAWLKLPKLRFQSPMWSDTEPVRPLRLAAQQLGSTFREFVSTSGPPAFPAITLESDRVTPALPPGTPLVRASSFQVRGPLARRPLLTQFELPAWPHSDLLTNTVVQVVVDAHGQALSAALLPPGSGRPDVDQFALRQAKAARFAPVETARSERPDTGEQTLTSGRIIFEWQTLPLETTNAPPGP